MKAFYFAPEGNRLRYGDNRLIRVGITHTITGQLMLCSNGLHGSERIIDALGYAESTRLYRTYHGGDILKGVDKLCSESRKYIQRFDIEEVLFEFARKAAKRNFHLCKAYMNKADYAIVIKFLDTGDKSLRAAARDAARGPVWDAARGAAWAAMRAAMRDATRNAAWAAARAAMRGAAWAASRAATRDAARGPAWDAEQEWQEKTLRKMITDKYGAFK